MKGSLETREEWLHRIDVLEEETKFEEVVEFLEKLLKDYGQDASRLVWISQIWRLRLMIIRVYRPYIDRLIKAVEGTALMDDYLVLDILSDEYKERYRLSDSTDIKLLDKAIKYRELCIDHINDSNKVLQNQNILGDLYVQRWIDYDAPSDYTKAYNTYLITTKAGRGMGRLENLQSIKEKMELSGPHIGAARLAEQIQTGEVISK